MDGVGVGRLDVDERQRRIAAHADQQAIVAAVEAFAGVEVGAGAHGAARVDRRTRPRHVRLVRQRRQGWIERVRLQHHPRREAADAHVAVTVALVVFGADVSPFIAVRDARIEGVTAAEGAPVVEDRLVRSGFA
jgi:hypothetical protein